MNRQKAIWSTLIVRVYANNKGADQPGIRAVWSAPLSFVICRYFQHAIMQYSTCTQSL